MPPRPPIPSPGAVLPTPDSGTRSIDKWPQALNVPFAQAKEMILRDKPGIKIAQVPAGAMVTADYRLDRVRVFVDSGGMVVKVPKVG